MRYTPDHKDATRRQLLAASAAHAKRHGFAASGMDALAGAAGLTVGALYKHFSGKDALFAELVASDLQRSAQLFDGLPEDDAEALIRLLSGYLSLRHVDAPEAGCPLPALSAEVARAPAPVRQAFQGGLQALHHAVARRLGDDGLAWTLLAQASGAVLLARALPDEAAQRALLAGVRESVAAQIRAARSGPDAQTSAADPRR